MVVDGAQVRALLLGEDRVAAGADAHLCVDTSTIAPAEAREIGAALAERDLRFVDAPVTGSSPRARDATLTIMAGGAPDDVARARPLLEAMGRLVVHVGDSAGQVLKLVNNAVAAANAAVLAQALVVARATGVDLDALVQVMRAEAGAARCSTSRPSRCSATTSPPCSRPSTCSRTSGAALLPGRTRASFPPAGQQVATLVAAMGRGHGADDFCGVVVEV